MTGVAFRPSVRQTHQYSVKIANRLVTYFAAWWPRQGIATSELNGFPHSDRVAPLTVLRGGQNCARTVAPVDTL